MMLERVARNAVNNNGEEMISWLIFLIIVVLVTTILYKLMRSSVLVWLGASAISTLIFQIVAAVQLGYVDKLSLIAVAITFPLALVISGAEILILYKRKERR